MEEKALQSLPLFIKTLRKRRALHRRLLSDSSAHGWKMKDLNSSFVPGEVLSQRPSDHDALQSREREKFFVDGDLQHR